jgi:hypothetical protein
VEPSVEEGADGFVSQALVASVTKDVVLGSFQYSLVYRLCPEGRHPLREGFISSRHFNKVVGVVYKTVSSCGGYIMHIDDFVLDPEIVDLYQNFSL